MVYAGKNKRTSKTKHNKKKERKQQQQQQTRGGGGQRREVRRRITTTATSATINTEIKIKAGMSIHNKNNDMMLALGRIGRRSISPLCITSRYVRLRPRSWPPALPNPLQFFLFH